MNKRIILLLWIVLFQACQPDNNKMLDEGALLGTWRLDSVSILNGGKVKFTNTKLITFKRDSSYQYEWWHGDVGNKFKGKYFILDNPQRKATTLALIPDLDVSGTDTIRLAYEVSDIIKVTDSTLVTLDQSKFIERKQQPSLVFNQRNYYKKEKQQATNKPLSRRPGCLPRKAFS